MSTPASVTWCLKEALRRFEMFNRDKTLKDAWTGLGTATDYKLVVKAGLMEHVHGPNPRYLCWWRLTDAGVVRVQEMIDE